jgi:acetyl coenzyme A synthetase (ADP forming)-like protein
MTTIDTGAGCDALLADGTVVHVRPIQPTDADRLVRFHSRLSPETTYMRFFTPHPRLSTAEVERFTVVDHTAREALVAVAGDEIIGVARYDGAPGTTDAEVAFVVDDAWQSRGVGTLLMEHLAVRARAEGFHRFIADTLMGNRRMLGVFRDSGLSPERAFDGTVVHLTMALDETPEERGAIERREHVSERESIVRLLEPRSVAVIGASTRPGSVGGAVLANIVKGGFSGPTYAVNARGGTISGLPAYKSIGDVPERVDLAIIAVPAGAVLRVAEECADNGVRGLVVVSAGFAEMNEEGAELQRSLVTIARHRGMRLVGPNCIGIANPRLGLNATFSDRCPPPGRIGLMSQSGAVGVALLDAASRTGLGISTFVSAGNKADVSGNDLLQYWEDDPDTDVVMLYLESLGNPRKFARLAQRVARRKPIVVVKSGRTEAGQRAASSHTAAMAASDTAADTLFRQAGVTRVDSVREMYAVARVLATQPLPAGRRIAIVGNSGGPGILAADACGAARLALSDLSASTRKALTDLAPPGASTSNPVDLLASAGPAEYSAAIRLVRDDPDVDAVVVIFTPTLIADPAEVAAAIAGASAGSSKPVVAAFITEPDGTLTADGGVHVPRFEAAEDAVRAIGIAADRADWLKQPCGDMPVLAGIDAERADAVVSAALQANPEGRWLDERECDDVLRAYGIPLVESATADSPERAAEAADRLGYPVAMKVASPAVLHKSDAGGVVLDLGNAEDVRDAWTTMAGDLGGLEAVTIQRMADPGVETIVGAVQDRQFGPLVMFGLGGTAAELLGDRAFSLLPLTDIRAAELVRSLRTSALLLGYRGAPPVDTAALEQVLLRVAQLVTDLPAVAELDLNPVIAGSDGVVAVDARIRVTMPPPAQSAGRHLASPRP